MNKIRLWTGREALLVITVGLKGGDSGLGLLIGKWLGKCLWNPQPCICTKAHSPVQPPLPSCILSTVTGCVLAHVEMPAKCLPLSCFSPCLSKCIPSLQGSPDRHGRREEQGCAIWCSLGFTSGAHSQVWQRLCFLVLQAEAYMWVDL